MHSPHRLFHRKKSFSILEAALRWWPAPPPVTRRKTGRQGDPKTWQALHPADVSLSKRPKSPYSSGSGLLEPSLTSDLPVEGGRQKEILPMGINKVSHYHLNAADCIFVSLHFSPRSKRVIWPCHGRSAVSVGEKVCRPKCQMIKEQSSALYASYLSVRLSAFKRQFITMSHLHSNLLKTSLTCLLHRQNIYKRQSIPHIILSLVFMQIFKCFRGENDTKCHRQIFHVSACTQCSVIAQDQRPAKAKLRNSTYWRSLFPCPLSFCLSLSLWSTIPMLAFIPKSPWTESQGRENA